MERTPESPSTHYKGDLCLGLRVCHHFEFPQHSGKPDDHTCVTEQQSPGIYWKVSKPGIKLMSLKSL